MSLASLPAELLLAIFAWLPISDLARIASVSHAWKLWSEDDQLWKRQLSRFSSVQPAPIGGKTKRPPDTARFKRFISTIIRSQRSWFCGQYAGSPIFVKYKELTPVHFDLDIYPDSDTPIYAVALTSESRALTKLVKLRNVAHYNNGGLTCAIDGYVESLRLRGNCNLLTAGTQSGSVYLWNIKYDTTADTATPPPRPASAIFNISHLPITAVDISPDGSRTACCDGTIRIIDTERGTLLLNFVLKDITRRWTEFTSPQFAAFSDISHISGTPVESGDMVVAGGSDRKVYLWSLRTGPVAIATLVGEHQGAVRAVQGGPGPRIISASEGLTELQSAMVEWDLRKLGGGETSAKVRRFEHMHHRGVSTLQFDQFKMVTSGREGVCLWEMKNGQPVRWLDRQTEHVAVRHGMDLPWKAKYCGQWLVMRYNKAVSFRQFATL